MQTTGTRLSAWPSCGRGACSSAAPARGPARTPAFRRAAQAEAAAAGRARGPGRIMSMRRRCTRTGRIVWLMEELGLEYKLEVFPRNPNGAAPDAMKAIQPIGRAPIIRDGDMVLAESGAIVEYVVHRHGNGRLAVAPNAPEYAGY